MGAAAVAEADRGGRGEVDGTHGIAFATVDDMGTVGDGDVVETAHHAHARGPCHDAAAVTVDSVATFSAYGTAEGTMFRMRLGVGASGIGNADGMDGHGVDIGVTPIAVAFPVGAVDSNTGGGLGPFLEVAVIEGLTHAHIRDAVVLAFPIAVLLFAEGVAFAACKEDVVDAIGTRGVAEARVGSGDLAHHVGNGLVSVEAVAPGEGGISPVDGHDGLVLTFTHPVEDVTGSDSGLFGNRFGHVGIEFNLHIVKAAVVVGGESGHDGVDALP